MFKSSTYFIKFGYQHRPKYLIYSILTQLVHSMNTILKIYLARVIIDEMFTKYSYGNAFYMVLFLACGSMLLQMCENIFQLCSENEKNMLKRDFDSYVCENLGSCDYKNIENPSFFDLKEKANYYIGGQWGEFGKQLDIIFELSGNIVTLVSTLYILIDVNCWVVLCYIVMFVANNLMTAYYKKKSVLLQMNDMPGVIRKKRVL